MSINQSDEKLILHYVRTSNGQKIAILLEEAGIDYETVEYDIFAGDHLTPAFREINPNQRLPALVDPAPVGGGGQALVLAETGAMLLYLSEKSGKFLSPDIYRKMEAVQWLAWQISGLGPMLGQAYHFARYAPGGQKYAIDRYAREARRLLSVMEARLGDREYLAVEYSIADMACWPWLQNVANIGIDRAEYPQVQQWFETIRSRPAVQHVLNADGLAVPSGYTQKRMQLTPNQWSNLFGRTIAT
ncbi:MAG: glutathione S-transferase N-terminal domain-containing protein [Alteraurantiacibacter sp.]